jgi:alpha-galactosidase
MHRSTDPAPRWTLTHGGEPTTHEEVPDFPLVRFDAGASVYQEALVGGQYLGVNLSASGRPRSRVEVWREFRGGAASFRPLRSRQHAFELEVDGQRLADGWQFVDSEGTDTQAAVRLRHPQRRIGLELRTDLDDTRFLRRRLVITNEGDRPCALSRVQPWSGMLWTVKGPAGLDGDVDMRNLPGGAFSVGRMTDSTILAEGMFDWAKAPLGRSTIESLQGRSGPLMGFLIVSNDATGELVVLDLGWSGNWHADLTNDWEPHRGSTAPMYANPEFGMDSTARMYASIGLAGPAPLRVLEPGESVATPDVHIATLFGGLDDAAQELHRHIRSSVVPAQPAGREQRVELNHTDGVVAMVAQNRVYDDIDVAAELGFELFMFDAGWFGSPDAAWHASIGDWDENPLLTDGMRAVMDRARSKGLLAGLWIEPEHFTPTSRFWRDHPDWLMRRNGETIPNIDLSIPEAARYLEDLLVSTIEKYALDCLRLDYNLNIGEGGTAERGGYTESVVWRYYDALYAIFDRIRARFPDLLLENCASGGSRADLGLMSRFHWVDLTDQFTSPPALKVLNGGTLALPPEICEGVVGAFGMGAADTDFTIRSNMFTHFDVSHVVPSLDERNTYAWDRWRHGIQLYKDFCRPLLRTAVMHHHTPIQRQSDLGDWLVLENAAPDRGRAYAGVFRYPGAQGDVYTFRPRGLDSGRTYRVTYDTADMRREIDGDRLMEEGIAVRITSALRSELLLFEESE